MKTLRLGTRKKKGALYLEVYTPYDVKIISKIKMIDDARWDREKKCWYFPYTREKLDKFKELIKDIAVLDFSLIEESPEDLNDVQFEELSQSDLDKLDQFKKYMKHRRYSESSIRSYINALTRFMKYLKPRPILEAKEDDIIDFVHNYIIPKEYSFTFQHHLVNAVKLFFGKVFHTDFNINKIERPRRQDKLPNVLSKEEIKKILSSIPNFKHKVILSLIYACGLRRSELLKLEPKDIDSKRGVLIIRQGKGRKDRIVHLPMSLIEELRKYYKANKPKKYLFEGHTPGKKYSPTSLSSILKEAVKKAGINKPVTLHWLRHSYATHLMEEGTDIRIIQTLLGHKSSRTTEIYTHVSTRLIQNLKSPFEDLDI